MNGWNWKRVILVVAAAAFVVAGCARPQLISNIQPSKAKDTYTRIKRVAMFPYENYSEAKDADKVVDTLLTPAVRDQELFDAVEDTRFVRDVMKKLKITATDILDKEVVKKLADEMNVQGILYGKVVGWSGGAKEKGSTPQVTMDMVFLDPSAGEVLWIGNVTVRGKLTWDEVFGWGVGYLPVDVAREGIMRIAGRFGDDVRDMRNLEKKGIVASLRTDASKEETRLKELKAATGKLQEEIDKSKAEAQGIKDQATKETEAIKADIELQKAAVEAEKAKAAAAQQAVEQDKLKVEMERKKIDEDLRKVEEERKKLEEERNKPAAPPAPPAAAPPAAAPPAGAPAAPPAAAPPAEAPAAPPAAEPVKEAPVPAQEPAKTEAPPAEAAPPAPPGQ